MIKQPQQTPLDHALAAARKGYSLIPVTLSWNEEKQKFDKNIPIPTWGQHQTIAATESDLTGWWEHFGGESFRFGAVTGPVSGLFVLDVELEGIEYLKDKEIPSGAVIIKTNRGFHYYFRWTAALEKKVTNKAGMKGVAGLDVRGKGGYVVAWGLEELPEPASLPEPPQWLLDLLPDREELTGRAIKPQNWITETLASLQDGTRNNGFAEVAGSLRARGFSPEDIFALLRSRAAEVGFADSELWLVCRSIGRYKPRLVETSPAQTLETFIADRKPVNWLVDGIIAEMAIGFVPGLPKSFKTWLVMDLAIECARGGQWLGRFPCKQTQVLYIDQERPKGETQRRFAALAAGKDITAMGDALRIQTGGSVRLNFDASYELFRRQLRELRPGLVIVDSWATFHTCDENNKQSIQPVLERVKELREEFKCAIVFVDHENKIAFEEKREKKDPTYSTMAGNIAKAAAAELILTVRRETGSSSMVYNTALTGSADFPPFMFAVEDLDATKTVVKAI
jgi:hypothetical protein